MNDELKNIQVGNKTYVKSNEPNPIINSKIRKALEVIDKAEPNIPNTTMMHPVTDLMYSMNGYLKDNLNEVPKFLKKSWDCVGIVSGSGRVRIGKCLSPDSSIKVIDGNGHVINSKPLGEYEDGEKLKTLSWDFENNKEVISESEIIKNKDIKDFYEVELEDGRKVICSRDHKLFVKRKFSGTDDKKEWKIVKLKLKDIKEGDELVCQN